MPSTVHPRTPELQNFELEGFQFGSENRKRWLALEDDFRTLGISQIAAELPQVTLNIDRPYTGSL